MKNILSCDLYDYLEIACMYAYHVELELKGGQKYTGKPQTVTILNHLEYLIFQPDTEPKKEIKLSVIEIKSMRVLTKNARFEFIEFS